MHGDTLSSVRFPNSVEARLKRAEASLREIRANLQDLLAAASQVSGPDGANTGLGVPDAETITATFGSEFSADGHYQPKLRVTVDPALAKLHGFAGYGVRLTSPDGSQQVFKGTISLDPSENFIVVNPIVVKQLAAPPSGVGSETYTVAVRVENSLFGVGRWGEEVPVTTGSDIAPPAQPTGLVVSGTRFNVVHVDFDPCTAPDYSGTQIFVTRTSLADLLVAVVKGSAGEFNYDSSLSAGWVNVYIKHFDKSNNVSIASAAVPLVARKAQNGDLDVITDPSRFAPWTDVGTKWQIKDSLGNTRVTSWLDTGSYSGNYMYRIQGVAAAGAETGFRWQTSNGAFLWLDPTDGSVQLSGPGGIPLLVLDSSGFTFSNGPISLTDSAAGITAMQVVANGAGSTAGYFEANDTDGTGVHGNSTDGWGVRGTTVDGAAVVGLATGAGGWGVQADVIGAGGVGVRVGVGNTTAIGEQIYLPNAGTGNFIEGYYNFALTWVITKAGLFTGIVRQLWRVNSTNIATRARLDLIGGSGIALTATDDPTNDAVQVTVDTAGYSGTVTLAKVTGGGANGSLTVVNGVITAVVNPT